MKLLLAVPALAAGNGAPISREGAQREARDELSHQIYKQAEPSIPVRILRAIARWLRDVLDNVTSNTPGHGYGVLVLLVLIAAGIVVLIRLRPGRQARSVSGQFDLPSALTAQQLREQAEREARNGSWAEALRSRLRAVVRELEDRTILDPRPGRTAAEVAAEAGAVRPDLRGHLWAAAGAFGEVWYGGRSATSDDYATVRQLDERLLSRRRVESDPSSAPPTPAVPA